jgi:hypothetical protein
MHFRGRGPSPADKALPYLRQAILREANYFALGCAIDAIKELTGKNFDLPQYVINHLDEEKIDDADKEKVDAARRKVERFFRKLYKE